MTTLTECPRCEEAALLPFDARPALTLNGKEVAAATLVTSCIACSAVVHGDEVAVLA